MAQRHRQNHKRQNTKGGRRGVALVREPTVRPERKPPTQYGKPFVVLEDADRNTFEYAQGAWVPYAMSIAQCRQDCQVKELPQKVNGKTRYEIRLPVQLEL